MSGIDTGINAYNSVKTSEMGYLSDNSGSSGSLLHEHPRVGRRWAQKLRHRKGGIMPSAKTHFFPPDPLASNSPTVSCPCPICSTPSGEFVWLPDPNGLSFLLGWCPACTNVSIIGDAVGEVRRQKKEHLLSAYLRRIPDGTKPPSIFVEDIERVTSEITEFSVTDQFDSALKIICDMCPVIGQPSQFNYETDWPLLTARSAETALFIVRELANAGYLDKDFQGSVFPPRPSWKAYLRLQEIQSSGRNSDTGFVAMSFAPDQFSVYKDVIKPAIEDAGYRPFRVDQDEHNRRIDDEIIAGIRRSRFLVADFTGQKNGVYFEAGMALGLGRNVIWMCHHSESKALHFDTRQFNHILYTGLPDARKALMNRIVALEGQGTYVPTDR
jgi:hypothetical protein